MGNYTGFRLSELKRFKPLAKQISLYQNGDQNEHESTRLKEELNELKSDPHNTYRKWKNEAQDQIDQENQSKDEKKDQQ